MMKKLFLTSALAAMLTVAQAAVTTYETTNTPTTEESRAKTLVGFTLQLMPAADSRLTTTQVGTEEMLPTMTVRLDQIDISITSLSNLKASGVGMALTDATGKILQLAGVWDSETQTAKTNLVKETGSVTWSFAGTEVATTEQLYFAFYSGTDTSIAVGSQITKTTRIGLDAVNYGSDTDESNIYTLASLTKYSSPSKQFTVDTNANSAHLAPLITIRTSYGTPDGEGGGTDNVPEPTSATLSLLALAGLAARRRRK